MPYKKMGTAIAHYLRLLEKIALRFGNPFVPAYLPDPVVIEDKKYSRETIARYLSWIKKFYRERGMNPPITIRYIKDKIRGRVSSIYVDVSRIDKEVEWLEKDEMPWPYKSRGKRDKEIEKLKSRIRRLEKKLALCSEELEKCRETEKRAHAEQKATEREYAETVRVLETELANMRERYVSVERMYRRLLEILRNIVTLTPEQVMNCVDLKPDTLECNIVRLIIDKAITYVDDITPLDVVMSDISDDYMEEINKITKKLEEFLSKQEKTLK